MSTSAILLGISSSTPTKDRNTTSLAIKHNGEIYLFDTAEGIQKQLMKTKTSYMDINNIFISHFHADHFLGLPGLIATMSLHERAHQLNIYGPKGIDDKVNNLLNIYEIYPKFEIKYNIIKEGIILDDNNVKIKAIKVIHSLETYGFIFMENDVVGKFIKQNAIKLGIPEGPYYSQLKSGKSIKIGQKVITPSMVMDYNYIKKGKSIGYFVDLANTNHIDAIQNLDIIFHEATFLQEDKLQAKKTRHSNVVDVSKMISRTNIKRCILVNFSARYKDLNKILHESQQYLSNVEIGKELMEYEL